MKGFNGKKGLQILNNRSFHLIKENVITKSKIKTFKFIYEPVIDLKIPFQYGIELEFVGASRIEVENKLKEFYQTEALIYGETWFVDEDVSVTEEIYGGELQSPISYNEEKDWVLLAQVCKLVQQLGGFSNDRCSVHIHVDFERLNFSMEDWNRFLKLWCAYEDVIFKFSRVGKKELREYYVTFAHPVKDYILNVMSKGEASDAIIDPSCRLDKNSCLNMTNLYHSLSGMQISIPTIEIRSCNGTLDPIFIQNIVRLFGKLLEAVKLKKEALDSYIETRLYETCFECSEKEIELSNLIFTNDFEKYSFLKQCNMKVKR